MARATTKRKLPPLSDVSPKGLKKWASDLRELWELAYGDRGNGLDAFITRRELSDANVITLRTSANGTQVTGGIGSGSAATPGVTTPPVPVGLSVTATLTSLVLQWDSPGVTWISHTEIWRADTNDLGAATFVGTSDSTVWADPLGTTGATKYYWIRFVNINGDYGPFNAGTTGGESGTTGLIGEDNFASTIDPVRIVSTLPTPAGYTGPNLVFLTTDRKLYRYDSSVPEWTTEIFGADISAGAVDWGTHVSGTGRPQDYAGATDSNLVRDPNFLQTYLGDEPWWSLLHGAEIVSDSINGGTAGNYPPAVQMTAADTAGQTTWPQCNSPIRFPVRAGEVIYYRVEVYRSADLAGAGAYPYMILRCYNRNGGSYIADATTGSIGTNGSWETVQGALTIPADSDIAEMHLLLVLHRETTAGEVRFRNVYLSRTPASLTPGVAATYILADAIQADMMAANSVIAGTIAAGAINTSNLFVDGVITGTQIATGTLGADHISVTSLSAVSANMGSITAGSMNISNKFIVDTAGNVTIRDAASSPQMELSNTYLRSGQTGFNQGNGFWIGIDGGIGKFSFGNTATQSYAYWDGSALRIQGEIYPKNYVPGSIILLAADTQRLYVTPTNASWVKVKEMRVVRFGQLRATWEVNVNTSGYSCETYIAINDVQQSQTYTVNYGTGWSQQTYDVTCAPDDTVSVWVRQTTASGFSVGDLRNFRLGNDFYLDEVVLTD